MTEGRLTVTFFFSDDECLDSFDSLPFDLDSGFVGDIGGVMSLSRAVRAFGDIELDLDDFFLPVLGCCLVGLPPGVLCTLDLAYL